MAAREPDNSLGFRPLVRDDLPKLFGWLRAAHVAEWWREVPDDLAAVEAAYGPSIDGDDPTELFVVLADGRDVGMIQRYLIADEPDWWPAFEGIIDVSNAAGIDYLIGELDMVGRGVGSAMIAAFARDVFGWRPIDTIVATVQQSNPASWRILEKAGFRRVWSGEIISPDPSDEGPEYVYALSRPGP